MTTLESLFYDFFTTAKYYSFSTDQICKSIVPIHLYEKAYYKYTDPEVRKNMVFILNTIIQVYCELDYRKCSMCDALGVYCYMNNNQLSFCYKHAPVKTMKRLPKSPFYYKRKPINTYNACLDAFVFYVDKTADLTIETERKIKFRALARCYSCLSTYMDDVPKGVYPKSYKKSDYLLPQKEPTIYLNFNYKPFVLDPKHIESRERWKKLHKRDQLFKKK